MTNLSELLERVQSAAGPDRELDRLIGYYVDGRGVEQERALFAEIGVAMWVPDHDGLTPYDKARGDRIRQVWQKGTRRNPGSYVPQRMYACVGPMPLTDSPVYTASVDAALAFAERVLPGWTIATLGQQDDKPWFCELREGYRTSYNRVAMSETSIGKRPRNLPLAIIAATVSALIAQEDAQ